jgi:hypothetical protein
MNWYKIRVKDGSERGHTFVGCSPDSFETLGQKGSQGEYLRLDDLLYWDRGDIKEWAQWDKREVASVYINPQNVIAIQPFKADPRTLAK